MKIRRAQPDETELVAQVLTAAAQNLTLKGQPLWDLSEVNAAAIERHVEAGLYFVASDNDGPVAVFRFQRGHLRLDCASGRPKLRSVYERFGFRHHSEKRIGRSLFDRFELEL
jgi:hypothetical protein